MKSVHLRLASPQDAPEILSVYAPYVSETVISFEYEVPSLDDFTSRIRDIASDYPYLVCVCENQVIGYAYAHRHMERAAYQWNAELSIYLRPSFLHRGIGRTLYLALMEILKLQNVRTVYGCVTVPNEPSEGLHESLGFRRLGVYRQTGYKCGRWHDVAWFEKQINSCSPEPEPFLSIRQLSQIKIREILSRYEKLLSI